MMTKTLMMGKTVDVNHGLVRNAKGSGSEVAVGVEEVVVGVGRGKERVVGRYCAGMVGR